MIAATGEKLVTSPPFLPMLRATLRILLYFCMPLSVFPFLVAVKPLLVTSDTVIHPRSLAQDLVIAHRYLLL